MYYNKIYKFSESGPGGGAREVVCEENSRGMTPDVEAAASPAGRGSREDGLSHGDAYAGPASPGRVDGLDAGDGDAYDVSCESDEGLGASDGRVGVEHGSHVPSAGGRDRELTRHTSILSLTTRRLFTSFFCRE